MLTALGLPGLAVPGFRYVVAVNGAPVGAFTECTLPAFDLDVEEVKEGGLNTYVHQLPGQRKAAKVTLKKGVGIARGLLPFYIAAMNEQFLRMEVTISLLNPLFIPMLVLHLRGAIPIRWTGPELRSENNTIAIQTFELACDEILVF
jgi:phage tail-like protein